MKLNLGIEFKDDCIKAVLVQQDKLMATNSVVSTSDRQGDLQDVIQGLIGQVEHLKTTTLFVTVVFDALRQRALHKQSYDPVVAIRLASNATHSVLPFCEFSSHMKSLIQSDAFIVDGGYQYDGSSTTDVDYKQIDQILAKTMDSCTHFAISGVFSVYNAQQEQQVKEYILSRVPHAHVVISSDMGGLSLLERENAGILSCSLRTVMDSMLVDVKDALTSLGLQDQDLYVCLQDGSMVHYVDASRYAIKTYDTNRIFECVSHIRKELRDEVWTKYLYEQLDIKNRTIEIDDIDVSMSIPSSVHLTVDHSSLNEFCRAYGSCYAIHAKTTSMMVTHNQAHDKKFVQKEKERLIDIFKQRHIAGESVYCDVKVHPVPHHPQGHCLLNFNILE